MVRFGRHAPARNAHLKQYSCTVDLRHALVHEREEADGRRGDAHGVDESTREV